MAEGAPRPLTLPLVAMAMAARPFFSLPTPHIRLMKSRCTWPAMLDGHAVRYTQSEAWVLINGAWRKADLLEVNNNASVVSADKFTELFGQVPELPPEAFKDG